MLPFFRLLPFSSVFLFFFLLEFGDRSQCSNPDRHNCYLHGSQFLQFFVFAIYWNSEIHNLKPLLFDFDNPIIFCDNPIPSSALDWVLHLNLKIWKNCCFTFRKTEDIVVCIVLSGSLFLPSHVTLAIFSWLNITFPKWGN